MGRNVTIRVFDKITNTPINGAIVQLTDCNGLDRGTGPTRNFRGLDGVVVFGNVPDGVGFLTVTREGYTGTDKGQVWIDNYHFYFNVYLDPKTAPAQTGDVYMHVITETQPRESIPFVHVNLVKKTGAGIFEGDTDERGLLTFRSVPYGGWSTFLSAQGYQDKEYSGTVDSAWEEWIMTMASISPEPSPEARTYMLEITFKQWAHGGLNRISGALSQIQTALAALNWDAGYLTWGNIVKKSETGEYLILQIPMMLSGVGSTGQVKTLVAWLKPLMKPAMLFILALGGIITSWKIVDYVDHKEEGAQQDQRIDLGQYLLDQGYSPEAIKKILAAIYGDSDGIFNVVIPIALGAAVAYVLGEALKK